jgi:uncharacterized membrane protein YfcA
MKERLTVNTSTPSDYPQVIHFWKHMAADWKPAVLVALPMFAVAIWGGISRGYEDMGLFAVAMALGTLHVAEMAVLSFRRLRELAPPKMRRD